MRVCAQRDPVERWLESGQRVLCWLHGPTEDLTEEDTLPREREEFALADEA